MNQHFIDGFEKQADALTDELSIRTNMLDQDINQFKQRKHYLQHGLVGAGEGALTGMAVAQGFLSGIGSQFLGKNLGAMAKNRAGMGLIGAAVGAGVSELKHYLDRKAFERKVLLPEAIGVLDARNRLQQRSMSEMIYDN